MIDPNSQSAKTLSKIDSATKYPSILNYHQFGDKGVLLDNYLEFGDEPVFLAEWCHDHPGVDAVYLLGGIMVTKVDIAKKMAKDHIEYEPEINAIYQYEKYKGSFENDPREPIKFLEVNPNTIEEGIVPIYFNAGIANGYEEVGLVVIEVSIEEFKKIEKKELLLPDEWNIVKEIFKQESK